MNKKIILFVVLLISTSIASIMMYSHSKGLFEDGRSAESTLFANAKDDDIFDLKGYLIKRIDQGEYLFKTDGYIIVVEIDDFVFPKKSFNERNLLNIVVKIDRDFLEPMEVEVERIDVL